MPAAPFRFEPMSNGGFILIMSPEGKKLLETILARATGTWPHIPVPVQELHDEVIHGHHLQKYEELPVMRRREELSVDENMQLDAPIITKATKDLKGSEE